MSPGPAVAQPQFSRTRSLVYASVIVLAFFAVLEGALRLVGVSSPARPRLLLRQIDIDITFPFMREDPALFWSPQPGFSGLFLGKQVTIDALGLRGPEPPPRAEGGRRLLLCLGDSITFGYGLSDEETYPAQLGRLLASRGVDVANGGVTGFTSHQVRRRLEQLLPRLRPDGVTVCIGWNDKTLRKVDDRTYARRLAASMALQSAADRLYLFRAMKAAYLRLSLRGQDQKPRDVRRVGLVQYRENLGALAAACRAGSVKLALVALPARRVAGEFPADEGYAAAVESAARELGLPLLQAGDLGLRSQRADTSAWFLDSLHFNAEGARLFAQTLAPQLEAAGLP